MRTRRLLSVLRTGRGYGAVPPPSRALPPRFATALRAALDCGAPTAPDGHDIGRAKPARRKRPVLSSRRIFFCPSRRSQVNLPH